MPVIGRLDGQVEEVLITPLGRRRDADEPADTDDDAPPPAPPHDEPQTRETPRARAELPVWLL